jgi:hypothetical protein
MTTHRDWHWAPPGAQTDADLRAISGLLGRRLYGAEQALCGPKVKVMGDHPHDGGERAVGLTMITGLSWRTGTSLRFVVRVSGRMG